MKVCKVCNLPKRRYYSGRLVCSECYCKQTSIYQKNNPRREAHAKYMTEVYNPKNRHKVKAMNRVTEAIKRGRLKRKNCFCGEFGEAHHHKGYAEEFWLDVVWLCRKHHEEVHHQYPHR